MIKDFLKNNPLNNLALTNICYAVKAKTERRGIILDRETKALSNIDSIADFDDFTKAINRLKQYSFSLHVSRYSAMSYFYGHYSELLNYCGEREWKYPLVGDMEHGIRFGGSPWRYDNRNMCYTCQGKKRISEIRDKDALMPIFPIGPYIQYARDYYENGKINQIKKKSGKTLLVFPSHSIESDSARNRGLSYIDIIFKYYAPYFDTIMACVYWNDVNEKDISIFKSNGAYLVSAGFRNDFRFIQRLKTIISLSDMVVSNDIGTNIGYSLYLGKKYALIDDPCREKREDPFYFNNYLQFSKAFGNDNNRDFSLSQLNAQKDLYLEYWGGGITKSKKDIQTMFSLTKKMYLLSERNSRKRKAVVKALLDGHISLTDEEYKCLVNSLSDTGWKKNE